MSKNRVSQDWVEPRPWINVLCMKSSRRNNCFLDCLLLMLPVQINGPPIPSAACQALKATFQAPLFPFFFLTPPNTPKTSFCVLSWSSTNLSVCLLAIHLWWLGPWPFCRASCHCLHQPAGLTFAFGSKSGKQPLSTNPRALLDPLAGSMLVQNGNPVASRVKLVVLEKLFVSSSYFCSPAPDTTDFHSLTHEILLLVCRGAILGITFHSFWSSPYVPIEKNSRKLQALVSEGECVLGTHTPRAKWVCSLRRRCQSSLGVTAFSVGYPHRKRHKHRLVFHSLAWKWSLSHLGNIHENKTK